MKMKMKTRENYQPSFSFLRSEAPSHLPCPMLPSSSPSNLEQRMEEEQSRSAFPSLIEVESCSDMEGDHTHLP